MSEATTTWSLPEERAHQELRAAHALIDAGHSSQAVSHAYLAGLHAASGALLVFGESPPTQVAVVSALFQRVTDDDLDPEAGRLLRRLFEDRLDVDFALATVPPDEARRSVRDAELLVRLLTGWIEARVG